MNFMSFSCFQLFAPPGLALNAVQRGRRDVAIGMLDSHQTWLERMLELVMRALDSGQIPTIGLQLFDDLLAVHVGIIFIWWVLATPNNPNYQADIAGSTRNPITPENAPPPVPATPLHPALLWSPAPRGKGAWPLLCVFSPGARSARRSDTRRCRPD